MADIIFADPTTTMDANTQKVLSILPPIQEKIPDTVPQVPISRPIDNHAKPQNLPRIQQQIQETSQPYTPKPWYDGKPSGGSIGSANALRSAVPLTAGQSYAQDEAAAALAFAAGVAIVGFYDGVTKAYSNDEVDKFAGDPDLGAPYYFGNKLGEKIRDIADNPPHFDIPQPKIPKIELPHLPEIKLPKLPEFELPEFKFPEFQDKDNPIPYPKIQKPKPVPKNLTRQLRELELSPCGSISFGYARASKVTGLRDVFNDQGGYYQERVSTPASIEEVYSAWIKYNVQEGETPPTIREFIEAGGQTGQVTTFQVNGSTSYQAYYGIGGYINSDQPTGAYPFNNIYYPYYSYGSTVVAIQGANDKSGVNAVLDHVDGGYGGDVYKINVSQTDAKDCPLGKPLPPPDPPDQNCDCMAQCCPDIDYRKIRAIVQEELKKLDLVSAIPLSWQIRNEGSRPQMVIQSGEEDGVDENGNKKYKSAKYPISVPHWDGSPDEKISLPSYVKGNYEGIYTLNDNSKITINAQNEIECKRILNAIKPHVSKQYLKDAYFKGGLIVRDEPIKESRVKPKYGRYFKNGQKNNKPDWRIDFL